jgi:hypothetical protein
MELLRRRAEFAERELRRIEVQSAQMAIAQRAELQAQADAKGRDEAEREAAEGLEAHRKNAWLNHRVDMAIAYGNDAFAELLSKPDMLAGLPQGWPPGTDPSMYRAVSATASAEPDEVIAATALGQALASKGVRL